MRKMHSLVALVVLSVAGAANATIDEGSSDPFQGGRALPSNRLERLRGPGEMNSDSLAIRSDMRRLWEDHVAWTRLFIVSAANGLSNRDATLARLLQNQTDIGDAIRPIYGEEAGDKLSSLLKEHILIASRIVSAAKSNDSGRVSTEKQGWVENSDQIADLLTDANPRNWSRGEMRNSMRKHLDLTLEEAVAEIKGDYWTSVRKYDQVRAHILQMSDMLSEGIVNQFPGKFSSGLYDPRTEPNAGTAMRMDSGTVLPFTINERLTSNGSLVGDKFTASLDTGDSESYQGMGNGAVLEGHVDMVQAQSGDSPGVLGLAFDRVRTRDGRSYPVNGSLIGLDSKSVMNENGRLVAKEVAKKDNLKYVGYGAGAGALLAVVTKGNILTNTILGAALGYLFGETQKNTGKPSNVTLDSGDRFGVRLTRDFDFRANSPISNRR